MSVTYKKSQTLFNVIDFTFMKKEFVEAVAKDMIVSQIDIALEMGLEEMEDTSAITLQYANNIINEEFVKNNTKEWMKCVIYDLQHELEKQIDEMEYNPVVSSIQFTDIGELQDIEVYL